jgi:hypothetical protein
MGQGCKDEGNCQTGGFKRGANAGRHSEFSVLTNEESSVLAAGQGLIEANQSIVKISSSEYFNLLHFI